MFLISLAMRPAAAVYHWCQRWLPSNRLTALLRTRRGHRWGIPAALLGVIYFVAGVACYGAVRLGHTEWLYLGMLICWWTALKLIAHGITAAIRLLGARTHENLAVRRAIRDREQAVAEAGIEPLEYSSADRRRVLREVREELNSRRYVVALFW